MRLFKILFSKVKSFVTKNNDDENDLIKLNLGQLKLQNIKENYGKLSSINEYEFKSFSQFGEDGLLQYLINSIKIENKFFVEIGVENYNEANTRFLLENDNWKGIIIDSNLEQINYIKKRYYYWKYNLKVLNQFITRENINDILKKFDVPTNIGVLSIDIDGNDYWIWEAISDIKPSIVVVEYNARFGIHDSVSVPYNKNFSRSNSKLPEIYFGASLRALYKLGRKKNYSLVCTNLNGNNAFFVRSDLLNKNLNIGEKKPEDCFHQNTFSEMRNKKKEIIKYTIEEEKKILDKLPIQKID